MPTLVDLFTDPISLAFFGLYAALWAVEALFPARPLPRMRGHRARSLSALVAYFLVSSYLPYWVAPRLEGLRVADLSSLGTWGGGLCALMVYQVLAYGWHRSMHHFDWLFRSVHQMHHSAERLDVASAFLFSPFDMVGWTLVSTVALSLVGVTPEATVAFVLGSTFFSTFQHANLRTPRFLGYLIQRPESHISGKPRMAIRGKARFALTVAFYNEKRAKVAPEGGINGYLRSVTLTELPESSWKIASCRGSARQARFERRRRAPVSAYVFRKSLVWKTPPRHSPGSIKSTITSLKWVM